MPDRSQAPVRQSTVLSNDQATASVIDTLKSNEHLAEENPREALDEMLAFLAARGPHALVLSRIAVLKQKLGEEDALSTAKEAAQLALSVGNLSAISETLAPFGEQWDAFELEPEQWTKLAAVQRSTHHFELAQRIYAYLLGEDPNYLRAVKGMLQLADDHLRRPETTEKALRIYDQLQELAPEHPFEDYVEMGRELAARQLEPSS